MNIFNKPRVFLSHASKDKAFIETLASDLRKCKIEPWLDTEEIRDGRPWLKVIFENGLPTCDAIIVYLTINSISSKMVQKEIDSALLDNLSDNGIMFLPYIEQSTLRDELRMDLKTLQCREWNKHNYQEILPSVISEIWHSYLERVISINSLQNRNKILELESKLKEIENKTKGSPFLENEISDFNYIYNDLMKPIELDFTFYEDSKKEKIVFIDKIKVPFIECLIRIINDEKSYYLSDFIENYMSLYLKDSIYKQYDLGKSYESRSSCSGSLIGIESKLKIFGLIKTVENKRLNNFFKDLVGYSSIEEFTEKMYRFSYWMGFQKYDTAIQVEIIQHEGDYPAFNA